MIKDQKETVGLNTGAMGIGTSAVPTENRTPTLADAGIDKKLSSHAPQISNSAHVPILPEGWTLSARNFASKN